MSSPIALSDEELDLLNRLAAPIAYGERDQFLQKVADALAHCPQSGPGVVHRTAREIQRGFTLQSQKETDASTGPRHFRARAQLV